MKVAFSKISITPIDVVGKAMAGYTRPDPCLGILDEVQAHGVLIEANEKILLISLDLLKIPLSVTNYMKEKINTEITSLKKDNILIHATHTHSAPDLTGEYHWPGSALNVIKGIMFGANRNDRYIIWMTRRIVDLVKNLLIGLKECKMAWSKEEFNPDIVINRRHPTKKPKLDLGIISFKGVEENELIGFIINYACHPTSLSFANDKLSADYPGRVIFRINKLTNNKISAVFFTGPAGELNPITTCGINYESLNKNRKPIYDQMGTYEHTKRIGYKIAEKALDIAKNITDDNYFHNVELKSYQKMVWIPMKDARYFSINWFKNKIVYLLKKYLILPVAMSPEKDPNFPGFAISKRERKIGVNTILQYIRIKASTKASSKKLSIITVPGELFHTIGELLKKKSPTGTGDTFIFQNSNDWIAYLFPLKEYITQGGYEPVASFSPISGHLITKEFLKFLQEIDESDRK